MLDAVSELVDGFQPAYGVPVLLGLALAFLFPSSKAFVRPEDKRAYRVIDFRDHPDMPV